MNKLEKLKQQRAELDERIAQAEKELQEPWPRVGDEYWYADSLGCVHIAKYTNHVYDHYRIAAGNCFRTEDEAKAYRDYQTDPRVVARGMVERMPGFDPKGKWVIYAYGGELKVVDGISWENFGVLSFFEENQANIAAINYPDLVKVALSVITGDPAREIVRQAIGRVNGEGE